MVEMEPEIKRKKEELEALLKADWRSLPHALMIFEPATSKYYYTGDWRAFKPVINYDKCIRCGLCWVYCPDGAMVMRGDGSCEVDLRYCKGCGICAAECPVKAIEMVEEGA
ncbi:MAG: 4Fe-4S binding protein [Candidatus Hecatellaceae archaeon]